MDQALGGKAFVSYEQAPSPVLFHLDEPAVTTGCTTLRPAR
jgi:hypothetical protein